MAGTEEAKENVARERDSIALEDLAHTLLDRLQQIEARARNIANDLYANAPEPGLEELSPGTNAGAGPGIVQRIRTPLIACRGTADEIDSLLSRIEEF